MIVETSESDVSTDHRDSATGTSCPGDHVKLTHRRDARVAGYIIISMQRTCANAWCNKSFEITDDDLKFYEEVSPVFGEKKELIPPPTLCPPCRSQRRYVNRNEMHLYKRKCDFSGKNIISIYSPDKVFPVYESESWYGDGWDPLEFGSKFDFSRPFFRQFADLREKVPRLALVAIQNENCPYVHQVWHSKNCHMCVDVGYAENALYCYATYHTRDAVDCAHCRNCELAFELIDCVLCYNCLYLLDCRDCHDSYYSIDCQRCTAIAFCSNLRDKKYCVFNREIGEEQWNEFQKKLTNGGYGDMESNLESFNSLMSKVLRRADHNINCENCVGDYLINSKNCFHCFDGDSSEDLRYCCRMDEQVKSSMDIDQCVYLESSYEGMSVAGHSLLFCQGMLSPTDSNLIYCDLIYSCSDCFGCVGLKKKRHCILNRQYSEDDYEKLVPKIIEHMLKTGEWSEFFHFRTALFDYNESVAAGYFPLARDQVLSRGWRWRDQTEETPVAFHTIDASELPDSIYETPDDVLNWVTRCHKTDRPYKIIRQELDFYRKMHLPTPRIHPDERHKRRIALRNPKKLWNMTCANCQKPIATSHSPKRPEKVVCEECYLKEVY